jgi:hypothetical protein
MRVLRTLAEKTVGRHGFQRMYTADRIVNSTGFQPIVQP